MNNKKNNAVNRMFAQRLKHMRNLRNYTQEEIAEKTDISRVRISRFETAQTTPDPESIIKLSRFLGVSANYLLGEEDYPDYILDLSNYYKIGLEEIQELISSNKQNNLSDDDELKIKWFQLYQSLSIILKKLEIPNHKEILDLMSKIIKLSYKDNSIDNMKSIGTFIDMLNKEDSIYSVINTLSEDSVILLKQLIISLIERKE